MQALCNGIVHALKILKILFFPTSFKIIPAQQKVGVLMILRNLIPISFSI